MRRLLLRAAVADEAPNALDDSLGLLEVGKVSGALDELETGSWKGRAIGGPVILGADEAVVGTPEEQRGHGDAMQPVGQLRIVEVRSRLSRGDRKSTRLNSSHRCRSYAVF